MILVLLLSGLILGLSVLLLRSYEKNHSMTKEKYDLIALREAALDISNHVLNVDSTQNHFQYILETCIQLIPSANYGTILMFNDRELLVAKASVGFNKDELSTFELAVEESFLYIASDGKMDETIIVNRIEDIILDKNIVGSGSENADFKLRSEISSPLYVNGELSGMLCLDGTENDIFTQRDIHILDYMSRQISNVISKQLLYNEVLYMSNHDDLTDLLNRDCFDKKANLKIEESKNTEELLHFVILDMDGLKVINDTYGHAVGDQMIRTFAAAFRKTICLYGFCARYGGDEFVSLVEGVSHERLLVIMQELEDMLNQSQVLVENDYITPRFSYGVASLNETGHQFDSAYKLADKRMYASKSSKRRNVGRSDTGI